MKLVHVPPALPGAVNPVLVLVHARGAPLKHALAVAYPGRGRNARPIPFQEPRWNERATALSRSRLLALFWGKGYNGSELKSAGESKDRQAPPGEKDEGYIGFCQEGSFREAIAAA